MHILASAMVSGPAPLPGFLNSLAGPLDHYGYGAIALLLLLESIGVPVIPGETALIAGAIFAGTGRAGLNVVLVGIVAVCASFIGSEIGYLIGKYAGRELVLRYGKYVLLTPHHLDRAEAITSRYGGIVVIIARFIVGLREANGIIAGITQMRWLTFSVFNAIGACAWVATWVTLGYVAGDHIATVYADINRYVLYLLIILAVLLVGYIGRLLRRRRRAARSEEPGTEEATEAPEDSKAAQVPQAASRVPEAAPRVPEAAPQVPEAAPQVPEAAPQVPEAAAQVPQAAAEASGAAGEPGGRENPRARQAQPRSS